MWKGEVGFREFRLIPAPLSTIINRLANESFAYLVNSCFQKRQEGGNGVFRVSWARTYKILQ